MFAGKSPGLQAVNQEIHWGVTASRHISMMSFFMTSEELNWHSLYKLLPVTANRILVLPLLGQKQTIFQTVQYNYLVIEIDFWVRVNIKTEPFTLPKITQLPHVPCHVSPLPSRISSVWPIGHHYVQQKYTPKGHSVDNVRKVLASTASTNRSGC